MEVFQYNSAGLYVCKTTADLSPLEPDVYLIPANSTADPIPDQWDQDQWPRFTGQGWELIAKPSQKVELSAVEKLAEFLNQNPDVLSLIGIK